jgi:hypothetical protein
MIGKLKELMERAKSWPEPVQDVAVATLEAIEEELLGRHPLTREDIEALEKSAEDVRLGRFASEERVKGVFGRHRRS